MKTKIAMIILFVLLIANTFSQNMTKKISSVSKIESLVQLTDSQKVILNNTYKKRSEERKKVDSKLTKEERIRQLQTIGQNHQTSIDSIITKELQDTILSKTYSNK
jgi:hypothetical protein